MSDYTVAVTELHDVLHSSVASAAVCSLPVSGGSSHAFLVFQDTEKVQDS